MGSGGEGKEAMINWRGRLGKGPRRESCFLTSKGDLGWGEDGEGIGEGDGYRLTSRGWNVDLRRSGREGGK